MCIDVNFRLSSFRLISFILRCCSFIILAISWELCVFFPCRSLSYWLKWRSAMPWPCLSVNGMELICSKFGSLDQTQMPRSTKKPSFTMKTKPWRRLNQPWTLVGRGRIKLMYSKGLLQMLTLILFLVEHRLSYSGIFSFRFHQHWSEVSIAKPKNQGDTHFEPHSRIYWLFK